MAAGVAAVDRALSDGEAARAPLTVLGHSAGRVFVLPPSGQLRALSGMNCEAGRGVRELVAGHDDATAWAAELFPGKGGDVDAKALGLWILDSAGRAGLFDPATADVRGLGVWREPGGRAVVHCGDALVRYSGGDTAEPGRCDGVASGAIYLAAPPTARPAAEPAEAREAAVLLRAIRAQWGWRCEHDAAAWLGWIGAAYLGGFPAWRSHLQVVGARGSGKSTLAEIGVALLGPMAGVGLVNGATEAGLRQRLQGTARALLLDEFEADSAASSKLTEILALARRSSGGAGGLVLRGGSDHAAQAFASRGPVAVSGIVPPPMSAADRSRFLRVDIDALPRTDPTVAASRLAALRATAEELGPRLWARALAQAERWDATVAAFNGAARALGADHREADTLATILAGLDLLTADGPPEAERVNAAQARLTALLAAQSDAEEADDGLACLRHLLEAFVPSSPARLPRSIADVIAEAVQPADLDEARRVLANFGLKVSPDGAELWVAGSHSQLARVFDGTRWHSGGWKAALLSIEGAAADKVRACGRQFRAVRVPLAGVWEREQ